MLNLESQPRPQEAPQAEQQLERVERAQEAQREQGEVREGSMTEEERAAMFAAFEAEEALVRDEEARIAEGAPDDDLPLEQMEWFQEQAEQMAVQAVAERGAFVEQATSLISKGLVMADADTKSKAVNTLFKLALGLAPGTGIVQGWTGKELNVDIDNRSFALRDMTPQERISAVAGDLSPVPLVGTALDLAFKEATKRGYDALAADAARKVGAHVMNNRIMATLMAFAST